MGLLLSYPTEDNSPLSDCFDSLLMKSLSSKKLLIEGSLSFKRKDETDSIHLETEISIKTPKSEKDSSVKRLKPLKLNKSRFNLTEETKPESPAIGPESPKHEAAVKLQKVYKSFRTRRQLADCAVLVEQHWWKLLDFALLKRSSVSFFEIEKPESVVSKWSRARTRAAKVGKGLSKDEKAQKLALQHWLEAIDPRHRYGHNLHFYYDCWLNCESKQPFFYWLDVGEGKEVNLEKCPRSKLHQQCIKYLGPKEREDYEVVIEQGKMLYKQSRQVLDTSEAAKDDKWIFVLGTSKNLYVGQKKKGKFQHSSFLAGGATSAAGRLVVENGILKAVWPHSGHYRPTQENFQEFMSFLKDKNVDLTDVKQSPTGEEEESCTGLKSSHSDPHVNARTDLHESEITPSTTALEKTDSKLHVTEKQEEEEEEEHPEVPQELILRRINSKKGMRSYQLGNQLSCKWSSGAGPRIGVVRDYPPELQLRALEQVSLSPRSAGPTRFSSPRLVSSPRSTEIL